MKIDNANRTAILDQDRAIRLEVMEILREENDVRIAKVAWLSRKSTGQYFHIAGESAYTRVYEPQIGPSVTELDTRPLHAPKRKSALNVPKKATTTATAEGG